MERYRVLRCVGEGTFGEVLKARHKDTGKIVALKKIPIRKLEDGVPKTVMREIKALQHLEGQSHVVKLLEHFPHGSSVVLVFEFMVTDLHEVLCALKHRGLRLSLAEAKTVMVSVLRGLEQVHCTSIMHRDIKPANLLFNAQGTCKLADFGLARVARGQTNLTPEVVTRWYKAPELLYGSRAYGPSVDMWAMGCTFAELLTNTPLFQGQNDIDQLHRIIQALGTPSEQCWPGVSQLPDFHKISFAESPPVPLSQVIPGVPPDALDLLSRLLRWCPEERLTATQTLKHPFLTTAPMPLRAADMTHIIDLPFIIKQGEHRQPRVVHDSILNELQAIVGAVVPPGE